MPAVVNAVQRCVAFGHGDNGKASSLASGSIPSGRLDATVSYGARDLRWINPSDHAVTVRASVEGNRLEVWLEGEGGLLQT